MIDSTIIVVAIGITFVYGSVSLVASQLCEALSSMLAIRSKTLVKAITDLVNDPNATGWALKLLNHTLINPQSDGKAQKLADLDFKPSYIQPEHFAKAFLDCIGNPQGPTANIQGALALIQDPQLRTLIEGIYTRSQGSLQKVQEELAAWFNNAMDRVSGVYKRRAQLICFCFALLIASIFNIDSLQLVHALWARPAQLTQLTSGAPPGDSAAAFAALQQLPIGWATLPTLSLSSKGFFNAAEMALGWGLTASSVLFGAPFWFDLLQRFTQLRGTGPKPPVDATDVKATGQDPQMQRSAP